MSIEGQLSAIGKSLANRQRELGKRFNEVTTTTELTMKTVKNVYSGKSCNLTSVLKIAKAFDWTIFDVIADINANTSAVTNK